MKNISLFFLLLLLAAQANALWMQFSNQDLIAKSDLIVSGTITGTKEITEIDGQLVIYTAILDITEKLKGDSLASRVLVVIPSPSAPKSNIDIDYHVGQKGLWLLREYPEAGEQELYLADHPQRFIPDNKIEDIKTIKALLAKYPN